MQQKKSHILVVEDDSRVANKFKRSLEDIGKIIIAKNSKEVITQISDFNPELILLDLVLEGDKENEPWESGLKILEMINASSKPIPTIVITGRIELEVESKCRELGVVEFFRKPVSIQILRDTVKQVISN